MIMDSTQKPYLLIKGTYTTGITIATQTFYAVFGRNYTQEEVDFAEIAEKCPWLENKLVDFSYFQRQGIISPAEYRNIMQ